MCGAHNYLPHSFAHHPDRSQLSRRFVLVDSLAAQQVVLFPPLTYSERIWWLSGLRQRVASTGCRSRFSAIGAQPSACSNVWSTVDLRGSVVSLLFVRPHTHTHTQRHSAARPCSPLSSNIKAFWGVIFDGIRREDRFVRAGREESVRYGVRGLLHCWGLRISSRWLECYPHRSAHYTLLNFFFASLPGH